MSSEQENAAPPTAIVEPILDDLQKVQIRNLFAKFKKMNEAHLRPALRFHWTEPPRLTHEEIRHLPDPEPHVELPTDDRWTSKLGGYPFWPNDTTTFPYRRLAVQEAEEDDFHNMGNVQLLAQFNLAEIATAPSVGNQDLEEALFKLNLPTDGGILQFFVNPDSCMGLYCGPGGSAQSPESFRVRYWPKSVVDSTTKLLSVDHFPQIFRNPQTMLNGDYGFPFDASRVLKITYGSKTGEGITDDFWGWSDFQTHDKFTELLRQEAPEIVAHLTQPGGERDQWKIVYAISLLQEEAGFADPAGGSKLGGHPTFTQDDPRMYWPAGDRDLLFQLESDGAVCVGDMGVMGFFNASGYSLKSDLSGGRYNWDCG